MMEGNLFGMQSTPKSKQKYYDSMMLTLAWLRCLAVTDMSGRCVDPRIVVLSPSAPSAELDLLDTAECDGVGGRYTREETPGKINMKTSA